MGYIYQCSMNKFLPRASKILNIHASTFAVAISVHEHLISWRNKCTHLAKVGCMICCKSNTTDICEGDVGIFYCFSHFHFVIKWNSSRFQSISHACYVHTKLRWQETLQEIKEEEKSILREQSIYLIYIYVQRNLIE